MTHGATSEPKVAEVAARLKAELFANPEMDHLRRPEFVWAVDDWAYKEARVLRMRAWADEQDFDQARPEVTSTAEIEERGKGRVTRRGTSQRVKSSLDELDRAETRAAGARQRIGLDPVSAARLAKDLSASRWYASVSPLDRKLAEIEENRAAIEGGADG